MQPFRAMGLLATGLSAVTATTIHANSGCIVVNDTPLCANGGSVGVAGGSATIYGRFDGNGNPPQTYSGCILAATWPDYYGDIYYGADNCLYDSNGQNIGGQCCVNGQAYVVNPYH